MPAYRIYYGNFSGAVFTADDLEAADDQQAIANAKAKGWSAAFEIWERQRLVYRHPSNIRFNGGKPPRLALVPSDD
jgi:hypothetical protein